MFWPKDVPRTPPCSHPPPPAPHPPHNQTAFWWGAELLFRGGELRRQGSAGAAPPYFVAAATEPREGKPLFLPSVHGDIARTAAEFDGSKSVDYRRRAVALESSAGAERYVDFRLGLFRKLFRKSRAQ